MPENLPTTASGRANQLLRRLRSQRIVVTIVRKHNKKYKFTPTKIQIYINTQFLLKNLYIMVSAQEAYVLQPIPGKGKGLIATRAIKPGELILSEPPLFTTASLTDPATFEKDLGAIVKGLSKDGQRAFLSLHNNNPGANPFSNIVRSNGYPLGPNSEVGAIFPLVARLNHACRPNAQHAWNEERGIEVVHAVRDIKEGESTLR